jgi:hypothetical protein
VVLLLTIGLAIPIGRVFAADRQARLAERLERGAVDVAALESVAEQWARTVALDPGNANSHYRLALAIERLMRAQWSSAPDTALVYGVRAMTAYRESILRNPTSPYPYLYWGWALESMSQLAGWAADNGAGIVLSHNGAENTLSQLISQLGQHSEGPGEQSRQLLQTATHLDPTTTFTHYNAGLYALQHWKTLSAEDQERIIRQLRSAVQLDSKYATTILHAVWERTRDRELVRTLARGTPEEARWHADDGKIAGGK